MKLKFLFVRVMNNTDISIIYIVNSNIKILNDYCWILKILGVLVYAPLRFPPAGVFRAKLEKYLHFTMPLVRCRAAI